MIHLIYLPEFDSYGVKQTTIKELDSVEIALPKEMVYEPSADAPTLGFLLGQDVGADGEAYYSITKNYLRALLNTGCSIRFLDYENTAQQMKLCQGVVLPGGYFDLPESFYMDGLKLNNHIGKRYLAYKTVIEEGFRDHKPLLGICAGAQVIGALSGGMKMYRCLADEVPNAVQHQPKTGEKICLHPLQLTSRGKAVLGLSQEVVEMNSRHRQAMRLQGGEAPRVPMEMYAVCAQDNVPEMWGNDAAGILCVQGHPEDLVQVAPDGTPNLYQKIYNYVADKAYKIKARREGRK